MLIASVLFYEGCNLHFIFARSDRERSPIAKKIWFPIHSQNFSSHLTVCLPAHLYHRGNQCKLSLSLASMGACNWYCACILWWIDICQNRISTDRIHWYWSVSHDHVVGLVVDPPWTRVFFLSSSLKSYWFSTDGTLISLQWLPTLKRKCR